MHEPLGPSSVVPGLRIQVDEAYSLLFKMVHSMRVIQCYEIDWKGLSAISWVVADDEAEDRRRIADSKHRLEQHLEDQGDKLQALLFELTQLQMKARETYLPIAAIAQFSYPVLGDFQCGESVERQAFPAIDMLAWKVSDWGQRCMSLYAVSLSSVGQMTMQERHACDALSDSFPLTLDLERQIRGRLYVEQGQMLRDLWEYSKTLPLSQEATKRQKNKGKKKSNDDTPAKEDAWKAFLLHHHRYSTGDLNQEPLTYPEVAKSGICSPAQCTRYTRKHFKSYVEYQRTCADISKLKISLTLLSGDMPLHKLHQTANHVIDPRRRNRDSNEE
jgi:hypothetical protein